MTTLAEGGKVRVDVQKFARDDAMIAYEAMRAGRLHGRVVIVP